jgi:3-methylfumaryl-CoA hydratase
VSPASTEAGAPTLQSLGLEAEATSPLAGELVERLAVTLDRPRPTDRLPITWHWAFFVPLAGSSTLGPDGHPRRPPGRLSEHYPRRMFAGGRLRSTGGLRPDTPTTRTSEIASAEEKSGRSGDLLLVTVRHRYRQGGEVGLEEEQDLVYRPASSAPTPLPEAAAEAPAAGTWGATVLPVRPLLFRYSALTFNAHRIHYDLPYASGEEGYPDLVVHGPLTATLLADLAADGLGRPLEAFRFRASAPLFVDQPVVLRGEPSDGGAAQLEAVRVDGAVAMTAEAS